MANNTQRVKLNSDDWKQLSGGNANVTINILNSDIYVYLTDSDDAPDDSANKDAYIIDKSKKSIHKIETALKVYVKKAFKDSRKCEIIYITE